MDDEQDIRALADWLDADGAGRPDAEARFRAVFARSVPRLAVPPGFQDRVMAAWSEPCAVSRRMPRWVWAGVAIPAGLAGISIAVWDPITAVSFLAGGVSAGLALATWSAAALTAWVEAGRAAWEVAGAVGRTSLVLAASGRIPCLLAANILVAAVSCAVLDRLLRERQEECL